MDPGARGSRENGPVSETRVQAWALDGIPEVTPGDDLLELILAAVARFLDTGARGL